MKAIHTIEAEAIEAAVAAMLAIRPDLNRPLNLSLARMVAGEAVRAALSDLRAEGHLVEATTGAAPNGAQSPLGSFFTTIDSLGQMGRIDPKVIEAAKPIFEGVSKLAESFKRV